MAIDFTGSAFFNPAAQTLARLAQVAARPAFELRFNQAQNAALERLDKEIEALQESDFGQAKTALLRIKAAKLERTLAEAREFKGVTASNRLLVKEALDRLADLRALADPASAAEFDAQRAQVLESLDKLRSASAFRFAAPDNLARTKAETRADIEGIEHNGFATPEDVQAAQEAIDGVSARLSQTLEILEINQDLATTLVNSNDRVLDEVRLKMEDIEIAERKRQIDKVKVLQDQLSRIFTAFSLAFEGSQSLTDYVAQNAVLKRRPEPGSVLNLFT